MQFRLSISVTMLLSLILISSCSTKKTVPASSLCEGYDDDLNFLHKTFAENNSNYNGDEKIRTFTDTVYQDEIKHAGECKTDLDYIRGIRKYIASFQDPHISATWGTPDSTHKTIIEASTGKQIPPAKIKLKFTATGIYLQQYDGRFFVKNVDAEILGSADVQIGDELKGCDGKEPKEILTQEILPYIPVSAKQAAEYRRTPLIFFRWDQNTNSKIKCEMSRNGKSFVIDLAWKEVTENYLSKKLQSRSHSIYAIEKTHYGHWVTLNSLAGYDEAANSQLKQFVKDAKTLQKDRVIVMDIRGNGGGNSSWGTAWIDNVFGYHPQFDQGVTESVFVSLGNIRHYERLYQHLKNTGGFVTKDSEKEWSRLLETMKNAPDGQFAKLPSEPSITSKSHRSKFSGKIIVLTDFNVFSSGETFLEQLKMMPNVRQAGIKTDASTFYGDVRFEISPLGLPFDFPTKMDSGDPLGRKSGEALQPDWPLDYDSTLEMQGKDSLREALDQKIKEELLKKL